MFSERIQGFGQMSDRETALRHLASAVSRLESAMIKREASGSGEADAHALAADRAALDEERRLFNDQKSQISGQLDDAIVRLSAVLEKN